MYTLSFAFAVFFPYLCDMFLELRRHIHEGVYLCDIVIWGRIPTIDTINFDQDARFSMQVPVTFFSDAFVVAALVAQPFLVELTALVLVCGFHEQVVPIIMFGRQRSVLKVALGEGGALVGEVARLVLPQEQIHARLHVSPVAASSVSEPNE